MTRLSCCLLSLIVVSPVVFLADVYAQTASIIPANEAAAHINEWATMEGVVAKVFTSKSGNTFLNIGATYPNQTFTGWIPNSSPVKDSAVLDGIAGKHVKITGRIELYKGKPEIRINAVSQLVVE
jgi:DNA/RNA endonuclease YhcR with UshA esterase domain